jgi:hypothetical protein
MHRVPTWWSFLGLPLAGPDQDEDPQPDFNQKPKSNSDGNRAPKSDQDGDTVPDGNWNADREREPESNRDWDAQLGPDPQSMGGHSQSPTSRQDDDERSSGEVKMSPGLLAGIVVGVAVVSGTIVAIGMKALLLRRRRNVLDRPLEPEVLSSNLPFVLPTPPT